MIENNKNWLLVKNRALGDSVMGLSTVQYIRRLYPNCKLYYAIPSWILPLYDQCNLQGMGIDGLIPVNLKNFWGWLRFFRALMFLKLDFIHEMQQNGRTAKFFLFFSRIFGWSYSAHNHHLGPDKASQTKVRDQGIIKEIIQRDLDGVYSFISEGQGSLPSFADYPPQMILHSSPVKKDFCFIIGVVATRESKMWPLSHYKELLDLILKHNDKAQFIIPLSSSAQDEKIKQEMLALGFEKDWISQAPLTKLPHLIASGSFYIGNDTGLKHIALALGLQTATFFGPEPYKEWHPYASSEKCKHLFFYKDNLSCRTKTHHYCGLSTCESMICLNEIKALAVWERLKDEWNL
jgi:heptosyltransferase-2